ncbi:MAG: hypothetical protein K2X68_07650 [Novosphingobium sp.]|nr:hypothetical protein [Novosphingobium sp.]
MMLFGKDFVRSLALGFALGSAAMVATFGVQPAQAASPVATAQVQQ